MTPLCELAKRYGTDKFQPHNYTPIYYSLLEGRAHTVKNVMEIGIGKGRSLRMWRDFFPNAQIVGIDVDARRVIDEERITSVVADQNDAARMAKVASQFGGSFDIIIDDGMHKEWSQTATMITMLPFLAEDGIYFIEDIKADPAPIAKRVPQGFKQTVHAGQKMQPSGRCEQLMIITRA